MLGFEVAAILVILSVHVATGLTFLLSPVLFILGLLAGIGVLYLLWGQLGDVIGGNRMSGSRFVSWYFALQIGSIIIALPVLFLMEVSAPLTALALGFCFAVTYSLWGRLLLSTPFFEEDEGLRAGAGIALNAALVICGAVLLMYVLIGGGYVLVEYVAAPLIRALA